MSSLTYLEGKGSFQFRIGGIVKSDSNQNRIYRSRYRRHDAEGLVVSLASNPPSWAPHPMRGVTTTFHSCDRRFNSHQLLQGALGMEFSRQ